MSPSGAQPAYFVTKDPITQFVIENSKEYKNGFIYLEMSQEKPGEHPRMAVAKAKSVEEKPEKPAEEVVEKQEPVEENAEEATEPEESESHDDGNQHVKVADKSDAIEWLKEHNPDKGYTANKLRGKAFDAACEECGVVFEFVG